jgi:hypothetical protein
MNVTASLQQLDLHVAVFPQPLMTRAIILRLRIWEATLLLRYVGVLHPSPHMLRKLLHVWHDAGILRVYSYPPHLHRFPALLAICDTPTILAPAGKLPLQQKIALAYTYAHTENPTYIPAIPRFASAAKLVFAVSMEALSILLRPLIGKKILRSIQEQPDAD